jgi:hypothetical protein
MKLCLFCCYEMTCFDKCDAEFQSRLDETVILHQVVDQAVLRVVTCIHSLYVDAISCPLKPIIVDNNSTTCVKGA